MLERIRIILVETTHPGNLGAVARAMKNMGLKHMVLVNPLCDPTDPKAIARASNATDVLAQAVTVSTLKEALLGCHHVVGTSAREREIAWPLTTPRECATFFAQSLPEQSCALVMGREKNGLTNAELALCHQHATIPTNPGYTSLNLGAALQIFAYEFFLASGQQIKPSTESARASHESVEQMLAHAEQSLAKVGYLAEDNNRARLLHRIRRIFTKASLTPEEVDLLRGIWRSIAK